MTGFVDANILDVCDEFTAPKAGLAGELKPPNVGVVPVLLPKVLACFSVDTPKLGVEGTPKTLGASCFDEPNAELAAAAAVPNVGAVVTGFAPKPPPNPPKG